MPLLLSLIEYLLDGFSTKPLPGLNDSARSHERTMSRIGISRKVDIPMMLQTIISKGKRRFLKVATPDSLKHLSISSGDNTSDKEEKLSGEKFDRL